jgi:hypothetical protein
MNITSTNNYNDQMIPAIIFGEGGFVFVFLDTTNGMCVKSEDVTVEWLTKNDIAVDEFVRHCTSEYEAMKDMGVEKGIISYFSKDDEAIYNFSKTI